MSTKVDLSRQGILKNLREKIARGEAIMGGGAGTGISAKCEEAGGIDLLVIYNSGRYRMAGRGSLAGLLAYGNANEIVKEMAYEVLPVVKHTPVLAGVNGTDPFMMLKPFLSELRDLGFAGIQNFPSVGLIDGQFRAELEQTGMGYGLEIDLVAAAAEMDMLTTPYVFDTEQAKLMTEAGADIVVAHMGCTIGGSIGVTDGTAKTLDTSVDLIKKLVDACKSVREDVIMLCHGGPIAMPDDAKYIIDRVEGIDGFYGASSMERLPTEIAIKEQIQKFKTIRLPQTAKA